MESFVFSKTALQKLKSALCNPLRAKIVADNADHLSPEGAKLKPLSILHPLA